MNTESYNLVKPFYTLTPAELLEEAMRAEEIADSFRRDSEKILNEAARREKNP